MRIQDFCSSSAIIVLTCFFCLCQDSSAQPDLYYLQDYESLLADSIVLKLSGRYKIDYDLTYSENGHVQIPRDTGSLVIRFTNYSDSITDIQNQDEICVNIATNKMDIYDKKDQMLSYEILSTHHFVKCAYNNETVYKVEIIKDQNGTEYAISEFNSIISTNTNNLFQGTIQKHFDLARYARISESRKGLEIERTWYYKNKDKWRELIVLGNRIQEIPRNKKNRFQKFCVIDQNSFNGLIESVNIVTGERDVNIRYTYDRNGGLIRKLIRVYNDGNVEYELEYKFCSLEGG